ncbi:MAG: PKD domain-containing protein [Bacteroidales bacterium]|nr:PKD domain-containing protein [Bacteroidales bacterium]
MGLLSANRLWGQVDTDFWFVVPELSHRGNTGGTPGRFRIATLELEAYLTVSMPANTYHPVTNPTGFQDTLIYIPANSAAELDLSHLMDNITFPNRNLLENKPLTPSGINNFGIHITSTNMINVYWEVNYEYGSDLWTLKGNNGLGTLFFTPFQDVYDNRNLNPMAYSAIDIVAAHDNTRVTITLPPGKGASYGSTVSTLLPGGSHVVNLNAGQTFSLYPRNYSTLAADRLGGTRIESDQPVGVVVKDDALNTGPQGQPVIGDQLVPVDIVGDRYIVPTVNNPNLVFVVATENNTPIYVTNADGSPVGATPYTTLNRGDQAMVILNNGSPYAQITSQANPGDSYLPFYVFQLSTLNQTRGGALVPSIGCTGNTQLAFARAREGENIFYFYLITEAGNEDQFLVDGVRNDGIIDPGRFTPIAGSGGWVAQRTNSINANTLPVGQHLVENTGGIFHLAIMNGFPGAGQGGFYYGYYSDFGGLNVGATVAGTNSSVVRACYGDPVQLHAFGGTTYEWTPDTYLDDAHINLPTAMNLPPGAHLYTAEVSGACGSGSIDLTVQVAPPVVAHFETNVVSGCSPLEIQFEDQSEGTYSWQYDFGDTITPLLRYDDNPATPDTPPPDPFIFTHTYTNTTNQPIDYEVTLLVKNESGCADILTKTITVFPEIHSDFTVDQDDGCDPLEVQFTNNSWGNTDSWLWEFGDGGSSTEQDPLHEYRNLFGPDNLLFDARLVAISPYNCRDTSSHLITVRPYIEAIFAYDTVAECSPHEIIISNQSIGADSYLWTFGDGATSTSPDTVLRHTYFNNTAFPVTYTIALRVENEEGCTHQVQREVTIYPGVNADFIVTPIEACSPSEMVFQNNTTGAAASYLWDFGDGGSSTQEHPMHYYDRNMLRHDTVFTVSLVATTNEFCRDTAQMDVTIHPYIEAAFTVDDVVGCTPFEVVIHNESIGADDYYWDFGDGSPVSNDPSDILNHIYQNPDTSTAVYPLRLIVTNEEGCSDTLVRNITVHPLITASFTTDGLTGCHPLTVTFTDLSQNAVNYLWDFGDGAASVEHSPVHTFSNFGTTDSVVYLVNLTTSTEDGECVMSVSWPITVYPQVEAEYTFPYAQGCGPFEVPFENLSMGGESFTWDFGDGVLVNTALADPQTHTFVNTLVPPGPQDFNISLTAENHYGCSSEVIKTVRVYPDIVAGFEVSDTAGCHPLQVDFTNLTTGGATYVWDFGDGSTSNLPDPVHVFTNTGTIDSVYTVKLYTLAPNNTCDDSVYLDIRVHPYIQANFTVPVSLGCNPFDVEIFNASVNADTFYWNFGDGSQLLTYNLDPIYHQFDNTGNFLSQQDYEITLVAENYAGCTDEIRRTITVEPDLLAGFDVSDTAGCHPLTINFTNHTQQGAAYYHWDFGNGTTSMEENPVQTFTNIGAADSIYRVWLYTTASNNECRDSFYMDILVHPYMMADFTFQEQVHCSPSQVEFHNASVGGDIFYWDFGDGQRDTTTGLSPVTHVYTNADFASNGVFQVTLLAENSAGCTAQMSRVVEVYPAIEAVIDPDVIAGCHPLEVDFSNLSRGGYTYSWDFGDGATSKADSPLHTFTNFTGAPVTRTVRLLATSQFNCTSNTTMDITIYPKPAARFETDQIIDCAPFDLPFTNTSIHGDEYTWSFGNDTTFTMTTMDPVSHTFDNQNADISSYRITLVASTSFGCLDTVEQDIYVYPRTIADFSFNDGDCSPFMAYFVNESVRGQTYVWDFGDGTGARSTDPSNLYFNLTGKDSVYYITLTSTSMHGCVDSHTDSVDVYAQPDVEFLASPTHQMYPDATVDFTNESSQGYWSYQWDLGDGTTSNLEDPPAHTYNTWGEYVIWLRASTPHCSDSVSHSVRILPAAPVAAFDTVIGDCEPHTVQFRNRSIFGETYLWDFDDGSTSTEFEPVHTYEKYGYYNVKLTVTGLGGTEYAYRQVEVYRMPYVDFRVEPELVMLPDEEIHLFNLSTHGSTYLWDFGDGNTSTEESPRHLYTAIGIFNISLEVSTEHGCTDRMLKTAAVTVEGEGVILFPNAFKPDLNGPNGGYYDLKARELNNIFHPYWEGVADYHLEIYTRWGEKLFYSDDVNKGWDGYFKEELCDQAVYVFKCWGFFHNGELFQVKGDVTLLHHNQNYRFL